MEPVASSRCPSQRDQARASARAFLFRVPAKNLRSQVFSFGRKAAGQKKTCIRRFSFWDASAFSF